MQASVRALPGASSSGRCVESARPVVRPRRAVRVHAFSGDPMDVISAVSSVATAAALVGCAALLLNQPSSLPEQVRNK
jgi:hypothetical protein